MSIIILHVEYMYHAKVKYFIDLTLFLQRSVPTDGT